MSAPARLLALRLQGFKSFAERTVVEFGPGISAIVGPNGAGKSNLADALRWALGEQGRALRSRKSEDVIFAGSERRSAQGMADVTLLLDNEDRLLPVEFGTVELGRRLYRSGENDYLLNRQRIRLRDLVDLLEAAHLADNAFLFIGQGMVDQALALRPEERRPLFEEVAGVRRHDRRRRRAEEQLAEAEANLARVEDILAELRPQARRLAVQAEQHTSRETAGRDFGRALLASGHARWYEGSARLAEAGGRHRRGQTEAERAMASLREAEEQAASIARELGNRSIVESERRALHDAARAQLTDVQLRQARLAAELGAIDRDRRRLEAERAGAEEDRGAQRRLLALPVPPDDPALQASLAQTERALAEATDELRAMRTVKQARGEALAALRRAEASQQAELDLAHRGLVDAERRLRDEVVAGGEASARLEELERRCAERRQAIETALNLERSAGAGRELARARLDGLEAARRAAIERAAASGSRRATLRARHQSLAARLDEEEARGIARAARRRGGRLLDEGLEVEPELRVAVEAVLGEAVRGYLVGADAVPQLATERGVLVIQGAAGGSEAPAGLLDRARGLGGGSLGQAVRRDPTGAVRRLLALAVWVPDLAAALELQPQLGPGAVAVTRDGTVVAATGTVALGRGESRLERRAEVGRLASELARLEEEASADEEAARTATEAAQAAAAELERARSAEIAAVASRRQAEQAEQRDDRELEAAARESAWHRAQIERLGAERDRLSDALELLRKAQSSRNATAEVGAGAGSDPGDEDDAARRQWEARVAELGARRDRLTADLAEQSRARRAAEERMARAAASVALDDERIARAEREAAELAERGRALELERATLATELAEASRREADARQGLAALRDADLQDRERLAVAETSAAAARERLRIADERVRAAEVAELEARLGLDSIREQVIVELAGLGETAERLMADALGEDYLADVTNRPREVDGAGSGDRDEQALPDQEADTGREAANGLEDAFERLTAVWAASPPLAEAPAPARLGLLRRRYHDLGAANPFAVEEYAAARTRLETLEGQRRDLEAAIARTRSLIGELSTMITEQFRATFRALEAAFDELFKQLFGGGFARLTLTDPEDLAATGVEILARPPGKKTQALAMLSGGERALTAVALLFAMLRVRPVPFCVLDEVDAALDEANVGRFVAALRALASETQCLVITHNRGTIEAADALYGATIGDDAVSRIISLRLEEAQAIAEQVRPTTSLASSPA